MGGVCRYATVLARPVGASCGESAEVSLAATAYSVVAGASKCASGAVGANTGTQHRTQAWLGAGRCGRDRGGDALKKVAHPCTI